jgi:hypothetical protein
MGPGSRLRQGFDGLSVQGRRSFSEGGKAGTTGIESLQFSNSQKQSRGAIRPSCASTDRAFNKEGAGNAGCAMHPQPRVQLVE